MLNCNKKSNKIKILNKSKNIQESIKFNKNEVFNSPKSHQDLKKSKNEELLNESNSKNNHNEIFSNLLDEIDSDNKLKNKG